MNEQGFTTRRKCIRYVGVIPVKLFPLSAGIPAHVLLNCTGLSPPGHVSRMELLSASGRSLRALSVLRPPDRGSSGLWNIPEFRSPSESFFLKLNGKDKDGYSFQRLSSVSYTNIIPGKWNLEPPGHLPISQSS